MELKSKATLKLAEHNAKEEVTLFLGCALAGQPLGPALQILFFHLGSQTELRSLADGKAFVSCCLEKLAKLLALQTA